MCFLQTHQVFFLCNLSRLFFAPCVTCDVISAQSNQINVSMTMMMMVMMMMLHKVVDGKKN